MQASKILLSAEEMELVKNSEIILTKNAIIRKMIGAFSSIAGVLQKEGERFHDQFPEEIFLVPPKISRGEQHEELPYVMLDYPRVFSREHVFAIRTFFWWGKFFSLTLHLKGKYRELYAGVLKQQSKVLADEGFFISISGEEWRQDFGEDNYRMINEDFPEENDVLKIAVKWNLEEFEQLPEEVSKKFILLMELLT